MDKKVLDKLESIDNRLDRIEIVQVEQAADLKYHISRTDALEEIVKPIYRRDLQLIGIVKFTAGISILIGLIKAIKSFF